MRHLWSLGLVAVGAIAVNSSTTQGDEIIRLGGNNIETKTQTLGYAGDADVELMRRGWGGGWGGGVRWSGGGVVRWGGGWGGGVRWGGWNNGWGWGGGAVVRWGGGWNNGWGWGGGWGSNVWVGRRVFVNSWGTPVFVTSSPWFFPCAGEENFMPQAQPAVLYSSPNYYAPQSPGAPIEVMPPPANGNGTYQYDGGPPSQMPPVEPAPGPTNAPTRPTLPRDGRLVSIPAKTTYTFQAYGEQPGAKIKTSEPVVAIPVPASGARLAYPAYGEQTPAKVNLTKAQSNR